jgi:hypothetical protein
MVKLVLASGCSNLAMAGVVLVAWALGHPGMSAFWALILCGVLSVTGVVLVLSSRDLRSRGSIVYYEGLARVVAAALLLTLGRAELGWLALVIGVGDLAWGVVQVVGLPRALGRTHVDMLLDRGGGAGAGAVAGAPGEPGR